MNEWEIHLIELADNDALTNFESVIVQLSPKEAVFPTSTSHSDDITALRKVILWKLK
jgi:DNA mismatch repair ATPase MutS